MHNYAGIYRFRIDRGHLPPRFYIGSAAIFRKRKTAHLRALRCGNHKNQILQRTFDKYALGHKQTTEHKNKVAGFFKGRKKPQEEIARRLATRAANRAAAGLEIY
jgi:hypothetical protein